jgi:hypothetical protein
LAVDVPVDVPDFGIDRTAGLFDLIAELGSKDFGESFDGEKKYSGGMPGAIP